MIGDGFGIGGRRWVDAQIRSPSDGGDVRWYFCKVPLAENGEIFLIFKQFWKLIWWRIWLFVVVVVVVVVACGDMGFCFYLGLGYIILLCRYIILMSRIRK